MSHKFDEQDKDLFDSFHYEKGYIRKTKTFVHRTIMERIQGRTLKKGEQVDHINGIRDDNRRSNIRMSTQQQNLMNRPSFPNTKSKFKNVYKHKDKWKVSVRLNGKDNYFGLFPSEEEARVVASKLNYKRKVL
jgi:hypothetical protein